MRKIYLVFTRDHNQWVNEMVDYVFVDEFKRLFGQGLSTQITHFTGRTSEWWRFVNEVAAWKNIVINKKLNDPWFNKKTEKKFWTEINYLRKVISVNPKKIENPVQLLKTIRTLFIKIYPYYLLALFLPGAWSEDFIKIHGNKSKTILKNFFESREHSEGILKEITNLMRSWLGPKLVEKGLPFDYSKLLSVSEVEQFLKNGSLPSATILNQRMQGFVFINKKIIPVKNFANFIKKQKIEIQKDEINNLKNSFTGSIAYSGKKLTGQVKIILNSSEMKGFKKGMVLVTPMTAPEYLPAMKLAAAIITDEGGLTCHAAIVSRELKKPCIIGTKVATQILKDGDMVEVDSSKGIVRKLK